MILEKKLLENGGVNTQFVLKVKTKKNLTPVLRILVKGLLEQTTKDQRLVTLMFL